MDKFKDPVESVLNCCAEKDYYLQIKPKIYVIDDSKEILKYLITILNADTNYDIFTFDNEVHALMTVIEDKPDLIIIDLNLTIIDGLDFVSILESLAGLKIPTVFISGDFFTMRRLSKVNDDLIFLKKPIDRIELVDLVNGLLNTKAA